MSVPDVSVITPVRNRAGFIETAIQSVLAQTHQSVEHVIVDGASEDETPVILGRYQAQHPHRIRFVSEPDRGGCDGFNKGCAMARGRIVGWLGSDDIYLPDVLREVVAHFDAHPNDDVVYGEAEFIDINGRVVGRFATRDFSVDRSVNDGACVAFPAVFYRREVIDTVGGFRVHDLVCDHEWLVRVGQRFPFTRLPITICRFRLHCGSTSASIGDRIYPVGNFRVNRRHGGRLLSPVGGRYLRSLLFELPGMKPIWERTIALRDFRNQLDNEDQRFAIFGAALSGFRCLEFLAAEQRIARLFIDNSPPDSRTYCERPVCTPMEFMDQWQSEIDAVIIATASGSRYATAMRRQLRHLGCNRPVYRYLPDAAARGTR